MSDPDGPVLGRVRPLAIGHQLTRILPYPSGWRAFCGCGRVFRGTWEADAGDRWEIHVHEVRRERGTV